MGFLVQSLLLLLLLLFSAHRFWGFRLCVHSGNKDVCKGFLRIELIFMERQISEEENIINLEKGHFGVRCVSNKEGLSKFPKLI